MQFDENTRSDHDVSTRGSNLLSALAIVAIMIGTCVDVLLRSTMSSGIPGVVEVSEILLAGAVFLGLAAAQADGRNVTMSLVVDRLGPRVRAVFAIAAAIIPLAFAVWLAAANVERAIATIVSGEYRFGLVPVPLWPGRVAVAVGCVLLVIQLVRLTIRTVRHPLDAAPVIADLDSTPKGGL